jgi:hypothetical protein
MINLKLLTGIENKCFRDYSILLKNITSNNGNFYTYNMGPKLLNVLKEQGLLSLFNDVLTRGRS